MKIIQNNYIAPKPEYPKEVVCCHCTSIFEVDEKDVIIKPIYWQRGRESEESISKIVICPCCSKNLLL
jgi:hypothetical protein